MTRPVFQTVRDAISGLTLLGMLIGGYGMAAGWIDDYLDNKISASIGRITTLVDQNSVAQSALADTLADATQQLTLALGRIERLEISRQATAGPVLRFAARGNSIEDGKPGDTVGMEWAFIRLTPVCGVPLVDLFFRNGGDRIHRFRNASILTSDGRGIAAEATQQTQSINYTVQIPKDEGVQPGLARGWSVIRYPDCPNVDPVTSPEVPFIIKGPDE